MKLVLLVSVFSMSAMGSPGSNEGSTTWYEAEDHLVKKSPKANSQMVKDVWATQGTMCQIPRGVQIRLQTTVSTAGDYYVYVRAPATLGQRRFSVSFGGEKLVGLAISRDKGTGWRWARVGPFRKTGTPSENRSVILAPTTSRFIQIDGLAVCGPDGFQRSIHNIDATAQPSLRTAQPVSMTRPDQPSCGGST